MTTLQMTCTAIQPARTPEEVDKATFSGEDGSTWTDVVGTFSVDDVVTVTITPV